MTLCLYCTDGKNSVTFKGETFCLSLNDIVQFATGMPHAPPLGFFPEPSLTFSLGSNYPIANTCGNVLVLPTTLNDLEEFGCKMCFGMKNSAGFGNP